MDRKKTTQFRTTEMSIQEEGLASLFISQKDQGKKEKKVPFWMKGGTTRASNFTGLTPKSFLSNVLSFTVLFQSKGIQNYPRRLI